MCDSYSAVVQELYELARPWKIGTPLVDGLGNIGDLPGTEYELGADPKYTEVRLSEEGVKYIISQGYDKIDRHALLRKHDIFYNYNISAYCVVGNKYLPTHRYIYT